LVFAFQSIKCNQSKSVDNTSDIVIESSLILIKLPRSNSEFLAKKKDKTPITPIHQ